MIERIEWKKEYEVGIAEIDAQHKRLIEIAGDLYDTITGDHANYKNRLLNILKSLGSYTVYHFSAEEKLMQQYNYPAADTHKEAHRNFISELSNQLRKFSKDSSEIGTYLYEYIGSWLLMHIAKSDTLFAEFILKKSGYRQNEPK